MVTHNHCPNAPVFITDSPTAAGSGQWGSYEEEAEEENVQSPDEFTTPVSFKRRRLDNFTLERQPPKTPRDWAATKSAESSFSLETCQPSTNITNVVDATSFELNPDSPTPSYHPSAAMPADSDQMVCDCQFPPTTPAPQRARRMRKYQQSRSFLSHLQSQGRLSTPRTPDVPLTSTAINDDEQPSQGPKKDCQDRKGCSLGSAFYMVWTRL